jgi:hypothetical protein
VPEKLPKQIYTENVESNKIPELNKEEEISEFRKRVEENL